MGLYDRDYWRQAPPASSVGSLHTWNITTWLIVLNVAVFVIDALIPFGYQFGIFRGQAWVMKPLEFWGHFSLTTAIGHVQLWRLITFQFLHAGLSHLLFNMLGLYFFGPMIEQYLGRRRFLAFYLLSGIGGPIAYVLLWAGGMLVAHPAVPLVGASAGIFGILLAAAQVAPNTTVMLMFPPIPMRLRTLAWVLLGIAAYTVYTQGHNAGGEAAHLGGALVGLLLIKNPQWLNVFAIGPRRRQFPRY